MVQGRVSDTWLSVGLTRFRTAMVVLVLVFGASRFVILVRILTRMLDVRDSGSGRAR